MTFDAIRRLLDAVDPDRLGKFTYDLVRIPSPTRQERAVAEFYAATLRDMGFTDIEFDETLPDSPNVIARVSGGLPGPTIQFAGHLDHIPVDHASPRYENGVVHGRGAADMKSGIAAMTEAVRLVLESGMQFPGELMLTTYGLHEAPLGTGEGLKVLLDRGVRGDWAIVTEGPHDAMAIAGRGQSIWQLDVKRAGDVLHEVRAEGATNPVDVLRELANALRARHVELQQIPHAYTDPGSYFIGQIHCGDFYNRVPVAGMMQGTRRWTPGTTFADVKAELHDLVCSVALPADITVEESWIFVGEAFELAPEAPLVRAYRSAYQQVTGSELPISDIKALADVSRFAAWGPVPAIYGGVNGETGHADEEWIAVSDIVRATKTYLACLGEVWRSPAEFVTRDAETRR